MAIGTDSRNNGGERKAPDNGASFARAPRRKQREFRRVVLLAILTVGIFLIDIRVPSGMAIGAFYSLPVILSLWLARRRHTLILAILCVILVLVGFLLSPPSEAPIIYALINRTISVTVILAFAIIGTTAHIADHLSQMLQKRAMGSALDESEARYRALVTLGGQSGQAIVMIGDEDGKEGVQVFFNETWVKLTGYSERELNKIAFFELIHIDDREACLEYHRRNMKNADADSAIFEMKALKKDGTSFPIEVACSWAVYRGKRVNVAYIRDIAVRKGMEDRLLYLASFPELNLCPIVEMGCDGKIHYLNPTAKHAFPELAEGNLNHTFVSDWKNVCERMKGAVAAVPFISEIKIDNVWYERTIWNVKQPGGSIRLRIYGNDVTERKTAEEALRTAEQNYRNSLDESPIGIRIMSVEDPFLYINKAALRMHGYESLEEFRSVPIENRYTPDTVTLLQMRTERARRGETVNDSYQMHIITKSGEIRHLQVWRKDVQWNGETQAQAILQDISEQLEAEKRLQESIIFNNSLLQNSPNPISVTNIDTSIRYVNPAFERLFGFKATEVIGKKIPYPWWTGETAEEFEPIIAVSSENRPNVNVIEAVYKKANGELFPVQLSLKDVKDGETIKYHVGNYVDLTEIYKAEETLRESEARFRQLAESTFEGIVISENGVVVDVNQAMADMLRTDTRSLIGKGVLDFIAPESLDIATKNVAEGNEEPYELICIRPDGTRYIAEARARMVTYGDRRLRITAVRDVTERKQMEMALKESEAKWRSLVQNAPAGIVVTTLEGHVIEMNDVLLRMHGYESKEEFAASSVIDRYVNPADRDRWVEVALAEGKVDGFEVQLKRKGNEPFWASLTCIIRENASGEKQFVSVVMDITERKQMQEQLILTDRLASLGQLSAGIAHELNNPLTGVIGFSELLMAREGLPPDVMEDIELIHREAERTSGIVKGLLTFARKQSIEKEAVDINTLLQDVLRLRMYDQTVHNIKLVTHFERDLPMVIGSGAQLQQVFVNLIVNAEQAMIGANKGGTLSLTTESDGKTVRICIEDNGPGIKPENMKRLFTPFFTTKEVGKGTGLGLSISHGIIEGHNGQIRVESEYGKGAAFIIELPVSAAENTNT